MRGGVDAERRERFLRDAQPLLHLAEGLATGHCAVGDFRAIWAVEPRAPVSVSQDPQGAAVDETQISLTGVIPRAERMLG